MAIVSTQLKTLTTDPYSTLQTNCNYIGYWSSQAFQGGNDTLLTKVRMPSTWAISNFINLLELWFHLISKINLLELWFHLISKINLFLLFHTPIPHPSLIFTYIRVLQDFSIVDLKAKPPD